MDLATINAMTNAGQQYLFDFLGLVGCASSAKQVKDFLRNKAPFLYSDWKFWDNVDKFFNSGVLSEEDKQKWIEKVSNTKNPVDTGNEIIGIIKKIETDKKLTYILRATKNLANDAISLPEYLRVCHVVMNTLEEDLQFLKDYINEEKIPYSLEVGGLIVLGLAYHTGVSEDNIPEYSFTALAKIVNGYAINGDALNKIETFNLNDPEKNVFFMTHAHITEEDIESIFDGTYEPSKKAKT